MTRAAAIDTRRDELLTVQEYATVARLNVKYIYDRIAHGKQPGAVKVGGHWRIDLGIILQVPTCCPNCGQRFGPPQRDTHTLPLPL